MDTSETYVKMCEKATEIQGRMLCAGDFYSSKNTLGYAGEGYNIVKWASQRRVSGGFGVAAELKRVDRAEVVWLPRQDQLQAMVISGQEVYMLLCDFGAWVDVFVRQPGDARDYASMEQLWLAYVMWTKYKKKWNSEDWLTTSR